MQTFIEKTTKNPETIIASRKYPIGGLKELQSLLNSDLDYFNSWCEQSREHFPSQSIYKYLLGFVLASLWVYSPNGRAGAVEDITLIEANELINSLSVGSTRFKSSTKHKIQPLILQDEKAVHIMRNYVDCLRPSSDNLQCLLRYKGTPFTQGTISEYIKSYFQKKGGYNITVTTLRMVQCSEVFRATVDGRVTESARKQFNYIQGHSERCNYAVYVKIALQENTDIARNTFSKLGLSATDVTPMTSVASPSDLSVATDGGSLLDYNVQCHADIARNTFSKLGFSTTDVASPSDLSTVADGVLLLGADQGLQSHSDIALNTALNTASRLESSLEPADENISEGVVGVVECIRGTTNDSVNSSKCGILPWPKDYLTYYSDWGTAHSCARKKANRVTWDKQEKQWIKNYMDVWGASMDRSVDKHKQLLQAIIDDPNARPLFHPNHVSAHLRLREAMRDRE